MKRIIPILFFLILSLRVEAADNQYHGSFVGNGASLTNLNAATLTALNMVSSTAVYTNNAFLGTDSIGIGTLHAGVKYYFVIGKNDVSGSVSFTDTNGNALTAVTAGSGTFTPATNTPALLIDDTSLFGHTSDSQVATNQSDITLPANVNVGGLTAISASLAIPLSSPGGGSGSNDFVGAVTAVIAGNGYATLTNAGTQTYYGVGQQIFSAGIYSVGSPTLSPPQPVATGQTRYWFKNNTNFMTQSNMSDCVISFQSPNPYDNITLAFPCYGTNHIGSIYATNSSNEVVYAQDPQFGYVIGRVQDANTNGENNNAGEFIFLNNMPHQPVNFSENMTCTWVGETGAGGFHQHPLMVLDTRGMSNNVYSASLPIGVHFPMAVSNVFSITNSRNIDALYINYTNGNVNVASNLFAGSITTTNGIVGITDGSNAGAEKVGEIATNILGSGSAQNISTASATNLITLSLTAGDWDVEGGAVLLFAGATSGYRAAGIETNAVAAIQADGTFNIDGLSSTTVATGLCFLPIPRKQINITSTKTVNLVVQCNFSVGGVTAYGNLTARRVR